jgi:hypothetical protein
VSKQQIALDKGLKAAAITGCLLRGDKPVSDNSGADVQIGLNTSHWRLGRLAFQQVAGAVKSEAVVKIDSGSELCGDASLDHPKTEGTDGTRRVFPCMGGLLFVVISFAESLSAERPPVRIAYFVPSDCEPIRDYRERLDRVTSDVQRFDRDGMNAAGFGPKSFALERDSQPRHGGAASFRLHHPAHIEGYAVSAPGAAICPQPGKTYTASF